METKSIEQLFAQALSNPVTAQQVYSNDTVDIAGITVHCEDIASSDGDELLGRRLHAYPNDKFVSISIFHPAKEIIISGATNEPAVQGWIKKAAQTVDEMAVPADCPECRFTHYEDRPVEWEVRLPDDVDLFNLDDHIIQSKASKIEVCFSMLGNCVSHLSCCEPEDIVFIVEEIGNYSPAYVSVYFSSEENAQKFAKLTGGEVQA